MERCERCDDRGYIRVVHPFDPETSIKEPCPLCVALEVMQDQTSTGKQELIQDISDLYDEEKDKERDFMADCERHSEQDNRDRAGGA